MTRESQIINRIVERTAGPPEWAAMEGLAAQDREVWSRLLSSMKQDALLRGAIAPILERAETAELQATPGATSRSRRHAWRPWILRVAAVLVLGLAAVGAHALLFGGPAVQPHAEGRSGAEAFAARGEVLGEFPRILIRSVPRPGGGFEVVSLRPVVERRIVQEAWQLAQDEAGNLVPTSIPLASHEPPSSL